MTVEVLVAEFKSAGGTVRGELAQPVVEHSPLAAWLRSEQASHYQGLWVRLSAEMTPVDSDLSPTALRDRAAAADQPGTIVFVAPSSVDLGV
jgi:hypothetical protein